MPGVDVIFPEGFVWGAATAAYQIEGAYNEGGRGPSIWDTFSHTPGKVRSGDTGDMACDSYHRYPEDIRLIQELGLTAYRFSVSWSRVFPSGYGRPNPEGLDYYKRLVDALYAAGVEPWVTLYHWDLPQALQDRGGWANRDTVAWFGEYAYTMARALGGVHNWITHNEPWVVAFLGHYTGVHAPGVRNLETALRVSHHLLLSHAEAMEALRAEMPPGGRAGITLNLSPVQPVSDTGSDVEAAGREDGYLNRWFLDPLFRGSYPQDMLEWYGDRAPEPQPGDMERIAAPIDFLGVNYYFRELVRHDPLRMPVGAAIINPGGRRYTNMGWEVYPEGLHDVLGRLQQYYALPDVYITENGAAFPDTVVEGTVTDPLRQEYIRDHLLWAHRAIESGVPLRGYFAWSLLDNFEWAEGYSKRFGLVYVDFPTQTRMLKSSGEWYARVTREHGLEA